MISAPERAQLVSFSAPGIIPCFLAVPHEIVCPTPLVSIHGISRNAREHAAALSGLAGNHGRLVIAPLFDRVTGKRYQRASSQKFDAREKLNALLTIISQVYAVNTARFALFGFSGGAQFAHRYALLHPSRIEKLLLASAGWYTSFTKDLDYPAGINGLAEGSGAIRQDHLDAFFSISTYVFVGEQDVRRDKNLNRKCTLDKRQGLTRVERGARWTRECRSMARQRGLTPRFHFETLANCGHDFKQCVERGGLLDKIDAALTDDHQSRCEYLPVQYIANF